MTERRLRGVAASPGLALGPLVRLPEVAAAASGRPAGDPDHELGRLKQALARAAADLARLAEGQGGMAAEVLAVQQELLEDPALVEAAAEVIAGGEPAAAGWDAAIGGLVAAYESEDDPYFRARAADLGDLRERVLLALAGEGAGAVDLPRGAILCARDLTPSRFLALDHARLGGAALAGGSASSHVAMLARARGVPLVTGLGGGIDGSEGEAILDADAGELVTGADAATLRAFRARLKAQAALRARAAAAVARPAATRAGERVHVMVNVDDPAGVDAAALAHADGVGLMRTEFLFIGRQRLPGEDEQLAAYAGLLARLGGRPLVVRTLDVGGDKQLPGVTMPAERDPFLGLRGIRLCLENPDLFRPQVRALLRAAPLGPLSVMLPMVATAAEVEEARAVFATELDALVRDRVAAAMPALGIMVETPAAAIAVDTIDAAFFSIGSNDLTQYVMAASREAGGRVGRLLDPLSPAVLRLIEGVVRHGARTGRPVSLCGDMASDPAAVPVLLGLGLRRLSVAPAALGRVKLAVSGA